MKKFKRYLGFVLVLAIITIGGCVLGIEYDTTEKAICGVAGAFACFALGIVLGWFLNRKHLLPE